MVRFSPHEFDPDPDHQCLGRPFGYAEFAPFYDEAERLLGVRLFPIESNVRDLVAALVKQDPRWRSEPMALGLSPEILAHPEEAKRFDAFASVKGLKRDAETCLLARARHRPNLRILTNKSVARLVPDEADRRRVAGVRCEDGSSDTADVVVLAAGALHSARLLQTHLQDCAATSTHPPHAHVGRNYKSHVLTAMLGFSHRRVTDVLCKTLLLLHDAFPHSTVQTLGAISPRRSCALRPPA